MTTQYIRDKFSSREWEGCHLLKQLRFRKISAYELERKLGFTKAESVTFLSFPKSKIIRSLEKELGEWMDAYDQVPELLEHVRRYASYMIAPLIVLATIYTFDTKVVMCLEHTLGFPVTGKHTLFLKHYRRKCFTTRKAGKVLKAMNPTEWIIDAVLCGCYDDAKSMIERLEPGKYCDLKWEKIMVCMVSLAPWMIDTLGIHPYLENRYISTDIVAEVCLYNTSTSIVWDVVTKVKKCMRIWHRDWYEIHRSVLDLSFKQRDEDTFVCVAEHMLGHNYNHFDFGRWYFLAKKHNFTILQEMLVALALVDKRDRCDMLLDYALERDDVNLLEKIKITYKDTVPCIFAKACCMGSVKCVMYLNDRFGKYVNYNRAIKRLKRKKMDTSIVTSLRDGSKQLA